MIVAWSPATPAPSAPAVFAEKDESTFAETRSTGWRSVFGGVADKVARSHERAALTDGAARGRVAVRGGLVGAKGDVDGVKLSKGKNGAAV